ncbi:L-asparaginase, type I [Croceitalea dokdonensis DOKDO 023]|uniref:asparaginase n=1 Tax=Croceitalea dokdonensis DOKDO 023 TaxID=1300341 RepID=A0A0P7ATW1_9FLAO|nr:asparaginase [Croceitalea dokdonensis]KPM31297.1 L-asparaginase, type I [Croceitalea dokdonensis DOKDO 023]
MSARPAILLIYTGGTIGMVKDYGTGYLKPFNFEELLRHIPELEQLDCEVSSISFEKPIDSSNMSPQYWVEIVTIIEDNYSRFDGFVVLHGSDTMSYSASALSFMLENLGKPVIFTGSQLPIGDLRTDAKENLITSIQIASLQKNGMPLVQEVCLYFEYKLYRGNRTTKKNAEHFEAFDSPNYPPLAESGVHLKFQETYFWKIRTSKKKFKVHKNMDANVAVLRLFPGIQKQVLTAVLGTHNLKVLILETYGAGNAPVADWFIKGLDQAIKKGIHVVNVTQCLGGSVAMGHYETSEKLLNIQVIDGKDITVEAAITKAMYLLGNQVSNHLFKTVFETSLRGEMH